MRGERMSGLSNLMSIVIIFAVFYFILLRPALRKKKKQAQLVATLRPGDEVMTVAGIRGTVVAKGETQTTLEIAHGVRVDVDNTKIENRIERAGETAAAIPRPMPRSNVCPQCGTPFKPGERFCGQCGKALSA